MKRTENLNEYRSMDIAQVEEKLASTRKEIMSLRFRKAVGRLESPARLKTLRRQVARAMTVVRERAKRN